MRALLEYTAGEKFMARDVVDMCRFMKDPEEILDYIENYRNYGGKVIKRVVRIIKIKSGL